MTNRIKTVQYPKLIFVMCKNSERISELISDILNFCSYNSCIDVFSENTDFVISGSVCGDEIPDGIIADTAIVDETCSCLDKTSVFRKIAAPYEFAASGLEDDERLLTFSVDNYSADVACRNISVHGDSTVFDVVSGGILSRARIDSSLYSVEEVLTCISVLIAAGIPLAPVLGYFNRT